ncbi:putative alpha/beta superfamily hydrolase [Epilithonimonas hungarica]|uniref:alpha/beta hydrolase n=1 Tax=Epilithonimonas hungarica TaxID=454006 RepID=UPI0027857DA2|nr:alpha/beta hydrolase-fold protein [Epilithonimonas hungarica]MDP9956175.1 putative alpha/beta superfamily hydrolase [Epilithonimonas hungarica]
MKVLSFAFLFIFSILSSQNPVIEDLKIGEKVTLNSKILNEKRTLNIYLPQTFDKTKSYPVIYILDGSMNEDFLHLVGLQQFFNMQFKMPDFIIVGIANVDRKRDFTFHTDLKDLQKDYPTTGHSDKFIEFVEKELQPFINQNYKTESTRYLIGQSLGGLLATEILLKKPELFTHYFIISPSLWWDNESLYNEASKLISQQKDEKRFVYISVGKNEHKLMVKEADGLYQILKNSGKKKLKLEYKLMTEDNHATILHKSVYEGFMKLFPYKE